MALIKFSEVVARDDLPTQDIPVPEWGGSVRVRHWTLAQRDEFLRRRAMPPESEENRDVGLWLISQLALNEDGTPWCSMEQAAKLRDKNPKAIDALSIGIMRLHKVSEETVEAAEKK